MDFKLSTFNCRGIQDNTKRRKIFHYLRTIHSDIIFLQETHCSKSDECFWSQQWGEKIWFANYNSQSRGVAILIRNHVPISINSSFADPNGRFLILSANLNDTPLLLVNVYGPNNDDPDFFLEVFSRVEQFNYNSILCAGDFNAVISTVLDYQGTRNNHSNAKASDMINTLMEEFNLCDIWRNFHPNLKQFTRHQKIPKVLSRLDFILVSDNFINNCTQCKILPGIQSDHSVVTLVFKDARPVRGRGFWKLNCKYLHSDTDFIQTIKEKIDEFKTIHLGSLCTPNILWDSLKCTITGTCIQYCIRKKKERKAEKVRLLREVEEIDLKLSLDLNNDKLVEEKEQLITQLNKILDQETEGLIIRSRIRWTEEGEKSSRYFCNLEKRLGEKKSIFRIKNDNDEVVSDQLKLLEEINTFYQHLYKKQNEDFDAIEGFLDSIDIPQLDVLDKDFLEAPLSKQELYDVVTSMKHNKSPGLDGLPVEFYIVFWKDISDMLLNSFNFSLQNGILSSSQRNGVITLIPKKDKDTFYLKNFRPISLLTVDYKILAKTFANRLQKCLSYLIHSDQSGFLKGRNIGSNIRLIIDILEYTDAKNIPGAILLLDIQKAFDSVSHEFLLRVLKRFNFSEKFIGWIKAFYANRKSYVLNYGNLTTAIDMERGVFQGCPISPYLFLLVIETMAIAIRQNDNIKGIPVEGRELKISLLADDSTCFINGSDDSFRALFNVIEQFSHTSGCKLNLAKSEAIWIGSQKGSHFYPYSENGLTWKNDTFKTLGITFSLVVNRLFDLNYKPKLKNIDNTLNCWRARNLSLVGKICVVKTLLLPQLLYYFSVLCIKIPKSFFKQLNTMFYKFIWNGGNDRVKRQLMCNDFSLAGLRMIDPYTFSLAQKMSWVKMLLDDNYDSLWKTIERSIIDNFNDRRDILWKANAPEKVLNNLSSSQLAESFRTWYIFRDNFVKSEFDQSYASIGSCQCIWYNKNVRSKSKQYFVYQDWLDKGIVYIDDLLNPPHPGNKLFEELVLDYNVSSRDRRKYNFLMKNIPNDWFVISELNHDTLFEKIRSKLFNTKKTPKYAYTILLQTCAPEKKMAFWNDIHQDQNQLNWDKIHTNNFKCTINTRIRSFYFKLFHKAIALNNFLYKIKRRDSPNCSFCKNAPENYMHLFVDCHVVQPIWEETLKIINQKTKKNMVVSMFEKMFGLAQDKFLTYLFLLLKYYIYICKFQSKMPNLQGFKAYTKIHKDVEYRIAKKNNKLTSHYHKWKFDL